MSKAIFTNQLSKNTTVQGLIDISDVVFELDILPSYTDIQELYPEFFLWPNISIKIKLVAISLFVL